MSSMWQMVPSTPSRMCDMARWNISGAEEIPNGRRLKQNLPKGVMNVVRSLLSFDRYICQNPLAASSFVNILLWASWAKLSSTIFMGWISLCTALFSIVKSTQILMRPEGFGPATMPEHHVVGAVTGAITPCLIMDLISSCTFGSNGCETGLAT